MKCKYSKPVTHQIGSPAIYAPDILVVLQEFKGPSHDTRDVLL